MLTVKIKPNESFDKAVRRFETECRKARILQTAREKMYFVKPSTKRKNAKNKARRKAKFAKVKGND